MIANIKIVTKQQAFPSGTIGAAWLWKLTETKPEGSTVEWSTDEPSTSVDVVSGLEYEICGYRVDPNNELLGSSICTLFTAAVSTVSIDVADSITVEVVE